DGSSDNTPEIARSYSAKLSGLKVVRLKKNRGKGSAVKTGLLNSCGDICVFLDADGSVSPDEIGRNLHYLDEGYDIFIGSRVLRGEGQRLKIKFYRKAIGVAFNFLVHLILFKDIRDPQCGFKMFRKDVIMPLFSRSYVQGFGFDIEILYLAFKMGYKVKEGPVSWQHIDGAKINLFLEPVRMFFNILQIKNWHRVPVNCCDKYFGADEYRYMFELENRHWWFASHRGLVMGLVRSLKINNPLILDIGTGTGINLLSLSKIGEAYGIDISDKAIEFSRERGLVNVSRSSAEKINYEDKRFDIITCFDVLEHIYYPPHALLEMKRVLKDNGKIVITVPAFRFIWSAHDEALCHLRRYTKASLEREAEDCGLKIDKSGYFFFASFFLVASVRFIKKYFFSKGKMHSDTVVLPPEWLNNTLKAIFKAEAALANRLGLPFGTTIFAIASKDE
ncbi:MAG: glycosyltransferase, partial [Candidatus Omnitrophota bacterium]